MLDSIALDKRQIERQFERAANSYDQAADLQRGIIRQLIGYLTSCDPKPSRMVDLGCGTGNGLTALTQAFPNIPLTGIDISQAMLEHACEACPQARLIKGDMENLPTGSDIFDLVFSSSSLQWCDLNLAASECARILQPNGYCAIATFGPKTHVEWREAWAEADGLPHTLKYPDLEQIKTTLREHQITPLNCVQETQHLKFASTDEVLRSVKSLGATNANTDRSRGLMGKERFSRFVCAFEEGSPDRTLTYEVFYILGQKKANR